MPTKGNRTLKDILDVILYNNPSTQEEIATKLGISRRYVTQLLKPLLEDEVVKRAYIVDLKKFEEVYDSIDGGFNSKEHSGNFLIQSMLKTMADHVKKEVELAYISIVENNIEKAEEALELDFTTNNMFEKIRSSVETVVSIDPHSKLSKVLLFNEAAYDYERIGDYSGHLAKFVINDDFEVEEDILKILKKMHKYAQKSMSFATDAFLEGKLELKGDIMDSEEKMHEYQKKAMNEIAIQMADASFDDIDRSNYYLYLSRVVKAFERMGDISVEIMELAAEFHKDIPRPTTPRSFRD